MPFQGAFQTTVLGWALRSLSGNTIRSLQYPDELKFPEEYTVAGVERRRNEREQHRKDATVAYEAPNHPMSAIAHPGSGYANSPGSAELGGSLKRISSAELTGRFTTDSSVTELSTLRDPVNDTEKEENALRAHAGGAHGTETLEGDDDPALVTWYGPDDPENPYNWSNGYKALVTSVISILTVSVYLASSIYSSAISGTGSVMEEFNVSQTTALLGLSLFVIGYGVGPMLFHPLSDLPQVGRLPVYVSTLLAFVAIQAPTARARNIHSLLALRFFGGFFGSPALAIGGATIADMYKPKWLSVALVFWAFGAVVGPVIGPLVGGFVFENKGWRWTIWVILWLSALCLTFVICVFPETMTSNILYRRMVRLRKASGNVQLNTRASVELRNKGWQPVISEVLWRPFQLIFEPTLLVYNSYLALIYGLFYLFFESFPLIFTEVHGFSSGSTGLAFLGVAVGASIGLVIYLIWIVKSLIPAIEANDGKIPYPEIRLRPCVISAALIPIAMFGVGWSGQYAHVHWIVPIFFSMFFAMGGITLFQSIFAYFGDVYNSEMGAVFTLNDLFRSSLAGAFPLYAHALFKHLGIAGGCSLLGGIAILFYPAPWLFLKYGATIRAKSKWAAHDD